MTSEQYAEAEVTARRFIRLAWDDGDMGTAAALLAPEFAHHDLVTYIESDAEGYLRSIGTLRSAFSSIRLRIYETIADGGRVASRWAAVGTHRDSGTAIKVDGMSIDHIREGRIVENWTVWDRLGLQRQLPELLRSENGD